MPDSRVIYLCVVHELPITTSLLDLALRHAEEAGGGTITALYLEVGKLSAVVDKAVQFYWDIISEGTAAAGARLHFRHTPIKMECQNCGTEFEPAELAYSCPACGELSVRVISGDEFRLEAIDLEEEQGEAAPAGSGSRGS